MKQGEDITESKVSLKTAVAIFLVVASYLGSLGSVYFTMKAKVDSANDIAVETKSRLDKFNPDVIVFQVTELREQVKESNKKADDILTLLRNKR